MAFVSRGTGRAEQCSGNPILSVTMALVRSAKPRDPIHVRKGAQYALTIRKAGFPTCGSSSDRVDLPHRHVEQRADVDRRVGLVPAVRAAGLPVVSSYARIVSACIG